METVAGRAENELFDIVLSLGVEVEAELEGAALVRVPNAISVSSDETSGYKQEDHGVVVDGAPHERKQHDWVGRSRC